MATLYGSIGRSAQKARAVRADKKSSTLDQVKDFLGKVAAHVPSEIVSVYAVGKTMAPAYSGYWTLFCWVLAVVIRWVGTNGEGKALNIGLTTLAFPIWAMALGGNILGWSLPEQLTGLAVLGFSVIAGFLYNNK